MKLLNIIIHGDVDKDFYTKYKVQLRERNIKMLKIAFVAASIACTLLLIYSILNGSASNNKSFHFFFAIWFVAWTAGCLFFLPRHPVFAIFFFAVFAASILMMTALLGSYFSPHLSAVTYLVFLIFVPGLYIDRPTSSLSAIITSGIIFSALVISFKSDPNIIRIDLVNTVFSVISSIIFNIYSINLHLKSIQTTNFLKEQSTIDELTSMPNRRYFNKSISEYFSSCKDCEITIIMMDIDYFKRFNDNYGHLSGDDCLSKVGQQLVETASRLNVIVARYGGEEFVAIDNKRGSNTAGEVANEFVKDIDKLNIPHEYSKYKHVTISAGYSSYPLSGAQNYMQLLNFADEALYKAKSNGRNRSEGYINKT